MHTARNWVHEQEVRYAWFERAAGWLRGDADFF